MGHFSRRASVLAVGLALAIPAAAQATDFSAWAPAMSAEAIPGTSSHLNTPSLDGCPIQAPDGLSLYMASNRARTSTSGSRGARASTIHGARP